MAKYGDKNNSLSGLFGKTLGKQNAKGTSMSKFLGSSSLDSLGDQVESAQLYPIRDRRQKQGNSNCKLFKATRIRKIWFCGAVLQNIN